MLISLSKEKKSFDSVNEQDLINCLNIFLDIKNYFRKSITFKRPVMSTTIYINIKNKQIKKKYRLRE